MSESTTQPMPQIPTSLDEAIAQAKQAAQAAVDDGYQRLWVELVIPELKVMPVAEGLLPAFESLGSKLRLFFPDAGAAALARRDWGEKPYEIRGIGELKAKVQPDETLFIFIEPSSVEVKEVEALCDEIGDRPIIFLNPRLEDIATIGIGYAGRQLRERFISLFDSCYYIRSMEGAALFRCYPSPWQLWREKEETYELVREFSSRPNSEQMERALWGESDEESESGSNPTQGQARQPRKGLLSGLQQFLKALSQ
ncbi:MAG: DUF1995 family protein [Elainellaceae cyanobacterium]